MATPRGELWSSKRREALKLGVEHQGLCAEHQKAVINHQKGWCWGLQHQPLIFEIIKKAVGI